MVYQIELKIDGMHCSRCESHINNTLRNMLDIKKVSSCASQGITIVLSSHIIPESDFHDVLDPTGYRVLDYSCQPLAAPAWKPLSKSSLIRTGIHAIPARRLHRKNRKREK